MTTHLIVNKEETAVTGWQLFTCPTAIMATNLIANKDTDLQSEQQKFQLHIQSDIGVVFLHTTMTF